MYNFSERLKNLRLKLNLSQTKFAEKIGRKQKTISRWENGKSYPKSNDLNIIAKFFNCRVNFLLGLED